MSRSRASLSLPLLLLGFASTARAADQFDADYATRGGTGHLSVAVDVTTPRDGAARIEADGDGLRVAAEGAGTTYSLVVGLSDGREALSLAPARECTPSRDGDGCWFDMAVLDAAGQSTGLNARVMVRSASGAIDAELLSAEVELRAAGIRSGLATDLAIETRAARTDIEFFMRFDHDGDTIDFDGPEDPGPDDGPYVPVDTSLDTYKILTYNVAGLPQTAGSHDLFGPNDDYAERADEIAAKIFENDYDIIVFNEVFADSMREELLLDLSLEYPFIIEEAWEGEADTTHRQDSGLMLFSRFPGDPTDLGSTCNDGTDIVVRNLDGGDGGTICDASFWAYDNLEGDDSLSEKGFFWAHLWNPRTNRPISIIGTHTQATYDPVDSDGFNEQRDARKTGFDQILEIVDQVDTFGEDLVFVGDLNVIGDYDGKNSEYLENFGPTGKFRDHDMDEMWRDTTSPEDPGFSWDGSDGPTGNMVANNYADVQERLDYMLSRDPSLYDAKVPAPCFQHMQLKRNFDGAYGDLSDHFGLEAVIGQDSDRCDPARAETNVTGGTTGSISYRGAYQWYRFDKPGTYSLQVYSGSMALDVVAYDATDLSTPLSWFEGDGEFPAEDRQTISVIDATGPFYLRVAAHDPTDTGDFKLTLNKNAGTSWTDYLVLRSEQPKSASFAQMLGAPNQDHVYFRFKQSALFSTNKGNQLHRVEAEVCPDYGCVPATFTLWNSAHTALYTSFSGIHQLSEESEAWLPNVTDTFFLTIDRTNENTGRDVVVTWSTDAKTVSFGDLTCHVQEDNWGDDDIYADLFVDGKEVGPNLDDLIWGQFDTNGSVSKPSHPASIDLTAIVFKSTIEMDLYEEDDIDDDDFLGSDTIFNNGIGAEAATTSPLNDPDADPHGMKWSGDDAAYSMSWWTLAP